MMLQYDFLDSCNLIVDPCTLRVLGWPFLISIKLIIYKKKTMWHYDLSLLQLSNTYFFLYFIKEKTYYFILSIQDWLLLGQQQLSLNFKTLEATVDLQETRLSLERFHCSCFLSSIRLLNLVGLLYCMASIKKFIRITLQSLYNLLFLFKHFLIFSFNVDTI